VKIAHVSDCYLPRLGGIELQVRDLAQRQVAAGHEVTVFTTTVDPEAPTEDELTAVVRVDHLGQRHRRRQAAGRIRYRDSWRARAAFREEKFDAVHVHASTFSLLAYLVAGEAARQGVPTVITLHSLWSKAEPLFHAFRYATGWTKWPLVWTAVSDAAADPLRRVIRERGQVAILPNGIDPDEWQVPVRRADPNVFRIAAVMRLAPRKRPLHLLRTLQQARRLTPANVTLEVEILGDGPERPQMERFIVRHDMQGWVRLAGRVGREEIRQVYARSDLFVAPATYESFGIAALEARCAGLPVLARAGTGVAEFVVDGRDGHLVGSDHDMARVIAGMAGLDPAWVLAQPLGPIPRRVTWDSVVDHCDELYEAAALKQGIPGAGQANEPTVTVGAPLARPGS